MFLAELEEAQNEIWWPQTKGKVQIIFSRSDKKKRGTVSPVPPASQLKKENWVCRLQSLALLEWLCVWLASVWFLPSQIMVTAPTSVLCLSTGNTQHCEKNDNVIHTSYQRTSRTILVNISKTNAWIQWLRGMTKFVSKSGAFCWFCQYWCWSLQFLMVG